MLLNSLEHLAYRVAGLSVVIYGLEKTNILDSVLGSSSNDITLALKTSAVLSGSEYLSDYLLSIVTNTKVPSLTNSIGSMGMAFVSNALVLLAMDKLQLDERIVNPFASDEMKAVQLGVLFVIVQEISSRLLHYYMYGTFGN